MKKRRQTLNANKIMISAMAVLGFNSCGNNDEPACEYGTPYATYEIKGTVTNEAGEAIPDIKIQTFQDEQTNAFLEPVSTDAQGKFTISGDAFPSKAFNISATDIDGDKNGSYETNISSVIITEKDKTEKGNHWYNGKYSKEVNIKMKAKK